jgi:hypothetical protein
MEGKELDLEELAVADGLTAEDFDWIAEGIDASY